MKYIAWEIRFEGQDYTFHKSDWDLTITPTHYEFVGKAVWNVNETWRFPNMTAALRNVG